MKPTILTAIALLAVHLIAAPPAAAEDGDYMINPGDLLIVTVWKEPDLTMEALVRPDGKFSFPLAGEVQASGRSVADVQAEIKQRMETYIPDAVITVLVKQTTGNVAYVVGKVNRPGPVPMVQDTTVMQALAYAGGTAQFAKLSSILILRMSSGSQTALPFDYDDVLDGKGLEQNVVLQPGDTVVVP
ncbi:MAG: polysaccharide biosynthesis/export family protein [Hydrogenophaga sp.]|uniref:polysaccharide biosynthesis/export family protein n=1 Tax=Hydrogenophaga sp. TaxID=1904254 RepID=UPI003D0B2058